MTKLVILTVAALALSSVVASAQTASQKAYVERAPTASQYTSYEAAPLIFGVAY
jgi:hypothetical protein